MLAVFILLLFTAIHGATACLAEESKANEQPAQLYSKQSNRISPLKFEGCYVDKADQPDFKHRMGHRELGMTLAACANDCKRIKAKYMGIGVDTCFCGDIYGNYGQRHDDWCQKVCPDDSSRTCGFKGYNSVYALL